MVTNVARASQGGERLNNNNEVGKALCRLFVEIAKREKGKAIKMDDYATAFIAAILEGIFKEAELSPKYSSLDVNF